MAKDATSPFTPGIPVPVEFFVGRREEIERLRQKMQNALTGRPEVAFISGERGIGKSSLASFVRVLCESKLEVLGIHALMGSVTTVEEAVRRVFDRLLRASVSAPSIGEKVRKLFGKYVREVDLFGVNISFQPDAHELRNLADNFASALRNVLEKMEGTRKGILLVLDDINGLAESRGFANWLKSLVDELAVSGQRLPLCIVLVGLEERRRSLLQEQPSLSRLLDVIDIATWSESEAEEFYKRSFAEVGIECQPEGLAPMVHFAGGLPVLAQEIGDATFKVDEDGIIDGGDALAGVTVAAEIVGRKHVEPLVLRSMRSERYRAILQKLAREPFDVEFSRSDVRERLSSGEVKVFDNFLRKMKTLGVISEDSDRGRGCYRFNTRLHYLYLHFLMQAERAE